MIGVIVAAGVDHQRTVMQVLQALETRCQHRLAGVAIFGDEQGRQVTEVGVVFPGEAMAAGVLRVPVAACCAGWCKIAVHLSLIHI